MAFLACHFRIERGLADTLTATRFRDVSKITTGLFLPKGDSSAVAFPGTRMVSANRRPGVIPFFLILEFLSLQLLVGDISGGGGGGVREEGGGGGGDERRVYMMLRTGGRREGREGHRE